MRVAVVADDVAAGDVAAGDIAAGDIAFAGVVETFGLVSID